MSLTTMETAKEQTYLNYLLPAIVIIVAALLRTLYLAEIVQAPSFSHPIYDPEYNAYWARGLATGDWTPPEGVNDPEITTTPHGRPPGYPWFLTAIYIVFGVNDHAPRIIQMMLGVVNALLLFHIGKRLFGRTTGFVAGLFMATYWVFPYFEGLLTYPVVVVFILLCLFLVLEKWLTSVSVPWAGGAGALLGCFALFRPNVLLFAPVLLLWMLWVLWRRQTALKRTCLTLSLLTTACVAVLVPAFIRNHVVARDFVFISAYGGINLYVGNHPDASLVEPKIPELMELAGVENWTCFDYPAIVRGIAAKEGKEKITFSAANRYFYRKAISFIREQPITFLKNLCRKALLFWGPHEITNDTVMEYDKRFSPTLRWLPGFPWCAALFVFGSWVAVLNMRNEHSQKQKHTNEMLILLWLYVGAYFLSVIIYFVAGRYRVPIIPVLLLFGAAGVSRLFTLVKRKDVRRMATALTALIILLLLFHWNPTGHVPRESTWHLRTAMAYTAAGDDDKAAIEYLKALEQGASASVVYANLGRLHINRGQRDKGMAFYQEGLRLNPNNPVIHNNLGYELYQEGKTDDAITHFEKAISANPRFALAHINLGNALIDENKPEKALAHFHAAAEITPRDAAIPYNIARILFMRGDHEDALSYYEKAIELRPEFAEALNNIGYLYALQ
ncbi:MAG TPA: tetratricopeptide repeat protein, partial [Candidatus Hydrogenedentes bacterium]|nr:tetratricopeptide repeat protein [Candidatus Hydrogenedentota bacterium]